MKAVLMTALGMFFTVPLLFAGPPSVKVGKNVADFSLKDLDGTLHKLSDFKGKIVVLEWTNPNCPFVQRVYRQSIMQTLQKTFTEEGIIWLAINSTNPEHRDHESASDLKQIYTDWKAAYTAQLLDPDGAVGKTFDARTTPHMFVINKNGVLVYSGALDDDPRGNKDDRGGYVRTCLSSVMEGKPVDVSVTQPYGCSVKYK